MNEDLKLYKKFLKEYNQSYFAFILLKLLVLDKNSFDYLLETQLNYILNSLKALEKKDLIRLIDEKYIATPKGKAVFQDNSDVDKVIEHFNNLKLKHLNIGYKAKCNAEKPSIRARLKEYGIENVIGVMNVKFNMWSKDPKMKHLLTSMKTMMVNETFESYIAKIELFNNIEKNSPKNSNVDNSFD